MSVFSCRALLIQRQTSNKIGKHYSYIKNVIINGLFFYEVIQAKCQNRDVTKTAMSK